MPSLKKNLFYSILLILANYVFPFLTYPYVSRVLGVNGIGTCNFVDSIINYFILFSTLRIDSLGVREIAKHKDDKEALDRTFSSIFIVNLSLTAIMLAVLLICTFTVPKLSEHKDLMFLGAFKLVFNCLLVEWLFRGLEDFRLITIRSILVKTAYVVCVFLFVRERSDVWLYYLLSSLMVVVNALVNMAFSRTRVSIVFSGIKFWTTFKSLLALGVYAILTSMYTTFNVTYLGFACDEAQVGYYTTATKIYYIVMALFTAFTNVMLPRMSNVVAAGETSRFKQYFSLAVDILLAFSIPVLAWMIIMAPDIVMVISGAEFGGAVAPMIIIAPLLYVVGYEQILVLQTLLPLGKDKVLVRNSIVGAIVGVVLNLALVPFLACIGSSIVWIVTECIILVLSQIAVHKEIHIGFPLWPTLKSVLIYLPLTALIWICRIIPSGALVKVFVSMSVAAAYMAAYQFVIRKGELFRRLK